MPKISPISWKKFEKVILFVGCSFSRQKGDHLIYVRNDLIRPVVFPKDTSIPIFVIRNNLRILNISHEEYLNILGQIN